MLANKQASITVRSIIFYRLFRYACVLRIFSVLLSVPSHGRAYSRETHVLVVFFKEICHSARARARGDINTRRRRRPRRRVPRKAESAASDDSALLSQLTCLLDFINLCTHACITWAIFSHLSEKSEYFR